MLYRLILHIQINAYCTYGYIGKVLILQANILLWMYIRLLIDSTASSCVKGPQVRGNLVWGFSDGAVETGRNLCYLLCSIFVKRTCWPFRSAADYLFTGREKYVSHFKHWRLIAVFLLQCRVSDWPAVEIIARLVVHGTGSHTPALSVWLPTPHPSTFIHPRVFRSQFYSSLHMQICSSKQYLSLVEAKLSDCTHYIT